jgi:hypothetical protein
VRPAGAVAVAIDRLGSRQIEITEEACRALAAPVLRWPGPSEALDAAVLVARLKQGERRIPPELHHAMSEVAPNVNLVLLCDEPLVDGRLRLSRGRVTLLAPPHSPASIAAELRTQLDGLVPALPAPAAPRVRCREQLRPKWWVARLTAGDGQEPEPRFPALVHGTEDGATVFLHRGHEPRPDDNELLRIAGQLAGRDGADAGAWLAEALGAEAAMVRFSAATERWQIHWPFTDAGLFLCSPARAPACFDLAAALAKGRAGFVTPRAFKDDLVVGLTRAAHDDALVAALTAGAPEALAGLSARLRAQPMTAAAALVLVR